jgi:hypothetical protein
VIILVLTFDIQLNFLVTVITMKVVRIIVNSDLKLLDESGQALLEYSRSQG